MSKFPFEKSIVIPLVDTDAMRKVRAKGETPFGLLTKTNNMSVLVRIYDFGDKSAICEATKVDLRAVGKIPIVAIIEKEEGGEYLVKMPSKQFTHEMNIRDGKIVFVKKEEEKEERKNAFFGMAEVKEEEQQVFGGGSHFGENNNSFNSLVEVIKSEGFTPDVPNILKFFADPPQSLQTSQWEKIDKDCQENQENQEFHQL